MTMILLSEFNQNHLKLFHKEGMQGSCHPLFFSHHPDGEWDMTSWESLLSAIEQHSSPIVCVSTLTAKTFFPWILFLRTLKMHHPTASIIFIATYMAYARQASMENHPALTLLRETLNLFPSSTGFVVDPHQSLERVGFLPIDLVDFYHEHIQNFSPSKTVIIAPDRGRRNFVQTLSHKTHIPSLFLTKTRSSHRVTLMEEPSQTSAYDKDILIFDDIIDSGATMMAVVEHLKKQRPRSLHIFVTHWLLQQSQAESFSHVLTQCPCPIYLYGVNMIAPIDFAKNLPPHTHTVTLDLSSVITTVIPTITATHVSTQTRPLTNHTSQTEGDHA